MSVPKGYEETPQEGHYVREAGDVYAWVHPVGLFNGFTIWRDNTLVAGGKRWGWTVADAAYAADCCLSSIAPGPDDAPEFDPKAAASRLADKLNMAIRGEYNSVPWFDEKSMVAVVNVLREIAGVDQ